MDHDYSELFDHACNHYSHYLDTVIHGLEVLKVCEYPKMEEEENIILVFKKPSSNKVNSVASDSNITLSVTGKIQLLFLYHVTSNISCHKYILYRIYSKL